MKIAKLRSGQKEFIFCNSMKKHHYQIKMEWTGNLGTGTKNYQTYSRDHEINGHNKQLALPGSSDPSFKGDESRYNPEELLVSTISSCHMLWYLHLCSDNKIIVNSYLDNAEGIMEQFDNGSGKFRSVTLKPQIVIENKSDIIPLATELHHKAHEMCFIANSVNFEVMVVPEIESA